MKSAKFAKHYLVFRTEMGKIEYIQGFDSHNNPMFTSVRDIAHQFCDAGAITWLNRGYNAEMRHHILPLKMYLSHVTEEEVYILDKEGFEWCPIRLDDDDNIITIEGNDWPYFQMALHAIGRI